MTPRVNADCLPLVVITADGVSCFLEGCGCLLPAEKSVWVFGTIGPVYVPVYHRKCHCGIESCSNGSIVEVGDTCDAFTLGVTEKSRVTYMLLLEWEDLTRRSGISLSGYVNFKNGQYALRYQTKSFLDRKIFHRVVVKYMFGRRKDKAMSKQCKCGPVPKNIVIDGKVIGFSGQFNMQKAVHEPDQNTPTIPTMKTRANRAFLLAEIRDAFDVARKRVSDRTGVEHKKRPFKYLQKLLLQRYSYLRSSHNTVDVEMQQNSIERPDDFGKRQKKSECAYEAAAKFFEGDSMKRECSLLIEVITQMDAHMPMAWFLELIFDDEKWSNLSHLQQKCVRAVLKCVAN